MHTREHWMYMFFGACVAMSLTACPSDDTAEEAGDEAGETAGDDASEEGTELSFESDVYPVITASCSCHVAGAPADLAMPDAGTAYANLVGVASSQEPGSSRVAAGDPAASYIVQKIQGTASTGDPMPPSGSLSAADEALVLDWIEAGANP